ASCNVSTGTRRRSLPEPRFSREGNTPARCPGVWCARALRRRQIDALASPRSRRDVAKHPSLRVDEDDAVSGRVAGVIFHLLSGNRDAAPEGDGSDGAMSGDDGDIVIALGLEIIGLVGIGFATA